MSKIFFYLYCITIGIILYFINITQVKLPTPVFATKTESISQVTNNKLFVVESSLIPQPNFLLHAHSATFTILPNNQLLAFWFAGSNEGRPDVKIWSSRYKNGNWSMAVPIVSPAKLSEDLDFYVKKVGNPVVYRDQSGRLYLFVVSVGAIGGWSVSTLNYLSSNDNGLTWSKANRLILSPFFNISTLDRSIPISLKDGGFYLPVYHEMINTYPELLRFDSCGNFVDQIRLTGNSSLEQPTILGLDANTADVFLRNHLKYNDILYMEKTRDGGDHWSNIIATNLKNHDSSIAVSRLNSHISLMVHNVGDNRSKLVLSQSMNNIDWQDIMVIESSVSEEFSYPVLIVHDHVVDILYTWKRQKIKHVRLAQKVLE